MCQNGEWNCEGPVWWHPTLGKVRRLEAERGVRVTLAVGKGDRLGKNQAMGSLCVVPLLGVCVVTRGGDKASCGDGALQLDGWG